MPKVIFLSILLISKSFFTAWMLLSGEGWRRRGMAGRFLDQLIKYGFLHKYSRGFG